MVACKQAQEAHNTERAFQVRFLCFLHGETLLEFPSPANPARFVYLRHHEHESEVIHAVATLRLPLEDLVTQEAFQLPLQPLVGAVDEHLRPADCSNEKQGKGERRVACEKAKAFPTRGKHIGTFRCRLAGW